MHDFLRRHLRRFHRGRMERLEDRRVLDSTVVFNEIMYHPPADEDGQLEWIELHNQLAVDMDVSDWRLAGGVDYTFPDGTIVPGRGQLVVAASPEEMKATTGLAHVEGPWRGRLANGGELLQLFNNDDRLMNTVEYGDQGDWPAAPDGSGFSLAKLRSNAASHSPQNWSFSSERGGTPGRMNRIEPGSFRTETLLAEGAPSRAWVPKDGRLGLDWTKPDFDDSAWTRGGNGVGFDETNEDLPYLGLDLDQPPDGQPAITMQGVGTSLYVRVPFEVTTDVTQFESIDLLMSYDDGFVAYLNGIEVAHGQAPGRDGNEQRLDWSSVATSSHSANHQIRFDITHVRDWIRPGQNMLAIHGLNRSLSDVDLMMLPSIVAHARQQPTVRSSLVLNEIASATSDSFFVEIINLGDHAVDLVGMRLVSPDGVGQSYAFTAQTLLPDGMIVVRDTEMGFRPAAGDLLLLTSPDGGELFDGQRVSDRLTGRSDVHGGVWYFPRVATPSAANQFAWNTDIVINEIMYHAAARPTVHRRPAEFQYTTLLPMDSDWVYNDSGVKLESDWAQSSYTAEDDWSVGQALIGFDTVEFPFPLQTLLTSPRRNNPRFLTYYFQTEFDVPVGLDLDAPLELMYFIDTGAIFYLNGVEIHRIRMPDGDVDANTKSSGFVNHATAEGPFQIPASAFVPGTNLLSVELHLGSAFSKDIMFGASMSVANLVRPETDAEPFVENDEEWIEFHNRGVVPVDLGGWQLRDAVRFEFPRPTVIDPGGYVVVAKDAATLAEKYPDVETLGNFRGALSNHDDRIQLLDDNDNLADEVHYYEGGRWPEFADGGASSLELRDPRSDNTRAEAWSASDESYQSMWTNYSYRERAATDVTDVAAPFNEFLLGLLDAGEFLIDDIVVTRHGPDGATQLIQNGTFQNDVVGEPPAKWRIIGNHQGHVVKDPEDSSNLVLHVVATGPQAHVHDHVETTFVNDVTLWDGLKYEISFRAKWLAGNSQLNSRLYFNRVASTAILDVPQKTGTPGRTNSVRERNIGPTYRQFGHQPKIPTETQDVSISVDVTDPDGVNTVDLHWRIDGQDGGDWFMSPMVMSATNQFEASIPAQPPGTVVQFFVRAQDTLGLTTTFPAGGTDSRALYQVDDGQRPAAAIDRLRMVLLSEDTEQLFSVVNRVSNRFVPLTLYHNDEVFYDVDVRLVGSRFIRPNSGYKVKLHPDRAFYGVHDSVRFDINGLSEIVTKQMINRAGGSQTSAYDDIAYLISPRHSGGMLLNLARYEALYLNEQFVNGSDGTKWELDVVTYPTGPSEKIPCPDNPQRECVDRESVKSDTVVNARVDIAVNTEVMRQRGDHPEFHRGQLLIKNSRVKDDYEPIVDLAKTIHLEGDELFAATNAVMDVDLWMRHYANQAYLGNWDTYGFGRAKNLRLYLRPSDDKFIPFFWDCDLCGISTAPLLMESDKLSRLDEIRDIPHNLRTYWGHMLDYMNRSFNEDYVARWASHYGALANARDFNDVVPLIRQRNQDALAEIEAAIPQVEFRVSTLDGLHTGQTVIIEGQGWVNVRQIRLVGRQQPLSVYWPQTDTWEAEVPLIFGENVLTLEAFDFEGNFIGSDTVTVVSDVQPPVFNSLRVSEIHYHPADPTPAEIAAGHTDADDFEFLELVNVGNTTLDLSLVQLAQVTIDGERQGLAFDFATAAIDVLGPGQRLVVVEDLDAFRSRYGDQIAVAGRWSGGLSNRGETVVVTYHGQTLQRFRYDPAWHLATNGDGPSLQVIDAAAADLSLWDSAEGWRPSRSPMGSPDATDEPLAGDSNGDGVFDIADLTKVFAAGKYEDGLASNATFAEGDWDGDGDFTSQDIVFAFTQGHFTVSELAAVADPLHDAREGASKLRLN